MSRATRILCLAAVASTVVAQLSEKAASCGDAEVKSKFGEHVTGDDFHDGFGKMLKYCKIEPNDFMKAIGNTADPADLSDVQEKCATSTLKMYGLSFVDLKKWFATVVSKCDLDIGDLRFLRGGMTVKKGICLLHSLKPVLPEKWTPKKFYKNLGYVFTKCGIEKADVNKGLDEKQDKCAAWYLKASGSGLKLEDVKEWLTGVLNTCSVNIEDVQGLDALNNLHLDALHGGWAPRHTVAACGGGLALVSMLMLATRRAQRRRLEHAHEPAPDADVELLGQQPE